MRQGKKKCSKCGKVKLLDQFWANPLGIKGKQSACIACVKAYRAAHPERIAVSQQQYYKTHAKKVQKRGKDWRAENPERVRSNQAAYVKEHQESLKAYRTARSEDRNRANKAWRKANPDKEAARCRTWRKAHSERVAANSAERRARRLRATPSWADVTVIAEFYAEAAVQTKLTGVEHHVDHIVPLKSKLVSGLHVEFNLRAITKRANLSKGNRVWPDMP